MSQHALGGGPLIHHTLTFTLLGNLRSLICDPVAIQPDTYLFTCGSSSGNVNQMKISMIHKKKNKKKTYRSSVLVIALGSPLFTLPVSAFLHLSFLFIFMQPTFNIVFKLNDLLLYVSLTYILLDVANTVWVSGPGFQCVPPGHCDWTETG